jgi:hypothetical protein
LITQATVLFGFLTATLATHRGFKKKIIKFNGEDYFNKEKIKEKPANKLPT